jgi:hypothetical protein
MGGEARTACSPFAAGSTANNKTLSAPDAGSGKREGEAPQTDVLCHYDEFCREEGLPKVPKPGFMKSLRDKIGVPIDKRQKRINGKQTWFYTGFTLTPNTL